MYSDDEENQILTRQLNEWNTEINRLEKEQRAVALAAIQLAQEIEALRKKHHTLAHKLRRQEVTKTSYYMWENIGDGG